MRILLLGGTIFLGPHLVECALARGHDLTVFHRGKHALDLPAGVRRVTGDRNRPDDLVALAGHGPWDAVIDTCGYFPRQVREAARALRGCTGRYVFVSSLSVYADTFAAADEDARLAAPVGDDVETVNGETYGPLKAACEVATRDSFGAGAFVLRPGLIVGPRDPTDRYTYWVRRIARGGTVLAPATSVLSHAGAILAPATSVLSHAGAILAPGDGSRLVQFVDVRDLAAFTIRLLECGRGGTWNVTGHPIRFDAFLAGIASATGASPEVRWIPEDTLLARGAQPWSEVPLWIGPADQTTGIARALADGLVLRDPVETARDTWAWDRTRDASRPMAAGLTPEREAALLV